MLRCSAREPSDLVLTPEKSKALGKTGFARWPKGPSGSGKTTTLRIIAGLEQADENTIRCPTDRLK